MTCAFLAAVLLAPLVSALDESTARRAVAIAAGPQAQRHLFIRKYVAAFPTAPREHISRIELVTPFRQLVDRATVELKLNNSYSERRAAIDAAREIPPVLRILVRVEVPWGALPDEPLAPVGRNYAISLRFTGTAANMPFTVTPTCFHLPCILPAEGFDGAVLESALPLDRLDCRGPITVSVRRPDGRLNSAVFDLRSLD